MSPGSKSISLLSLNHGKPLPEAPPGSLLPGASSREPPGAFHRGKNCGQAVRRPITYYYHTAALRKDLRPVLPVKHNFSEHIFFYAELLPYTPGSGAPGASSAVEPCISLKVLPGLVS